MSRSVLLLALIGLVPPAVAWDAAVHRTVTLLALDGLAAETAPWLRSAETRERVAFQSGQPDRWRGWPANALRHVNDPDHYLDIELLDQFGLSLETLPALRREYLRRLVLAKHLHPERVDPYDPTRDPARIREWPGFLPYAISEQYAKLQAAFNQVRILEKLGDPARTAQLAQAREIAIYHLGALSHFVVDAAQPLHTTRHFNGWVGPNPAGYTTSTEFHRYVDTTLVARHGLTSTTLRPPAKGRQRIRNPQNPWREILAYIGRSHQEVETLYRLERDGQLEGVAGREFVSGQLVGAAQMLTALVESAWEAAEPTAEQVERWVHYNPLPSEQRREQPVPAGATP